MEVDFLNLNNTAINLSVRAMKLCTVLDRMPSTTNLSDRAKKQILDTITENILNLVGYTAPEFVPDQEVITKLTLAATACAKIQGTLLLYNNLQPIPDNSLLTLLMEISQFGNKLRSVAAPEENIETPAKE